MLFSGKSWYIFPGTDFAITIVVRHVNILLTCHKDKNLKHWCLKCQSTCLYFKIYLIESDSKKSVQGDFQPCLSDKLLCLCVSHGMQMMGKGYNYSLHTNHPYHQVMKATRFSKSKYRKKVTGQPTGYKICMSFDFIAHPF